MTAGLRSFFGILIALVLVALGVYGLQNEEHVPVYFLFFTFHGTQAWIPAAVFTLLMFAICLIYGLLSGTVWLFRRRRLVRATSEHQSRAESLSRELDEARAEVTRLREAATRRDEERPVADTLESRRSHEPPAGSQASPAPSREAPVPSPGPRAEQPPASSPEPAPRSQAPPAQQPPPPRAQQPPASSQEPPPPQQPQD